MSKKINRNWAIIRSNCILTALHTFKAEKPPGHRLKLSTCDITFNKKDTKLTKKFTSIRVAINSGPNLAISEQGSKIGNISDNYRQNI